MKNKKQIKKKVKRLDATTEKGKAKQVPCQQKQCGFQKGGCPKCSECGANSLMINENCKTCFNCEFKPNSIRDGRDKSGTNEEDIKNKIEDMFKNALGKNAKVVKTPKRLLTANGEVEDEPEMERHPEPKHNQNSQKNNLMGGVDFEKELKAELIKQMASNILATAQDAAMKVKDEKENGKCKGKCKEDEQEKPKKFLPYIG